jgi:hypothetical protein
VLACDFEFLTFHVFGSVLLTFTDYRHQNPNRCTG